jgi:hypothetical protein
MWRPNRRTHDADRLAGRGPLRHEPLAQDPAVKVIAVFPISPTELAVRDEQRLNSPSSPGVIRSKWRDRPPGERLLLCWYDGPIGIPGGGNPRADRFVIVLGDDMVQFLAAGPRASLPITSDPP